MDVIGLDGFGNALDRNAAVGLIPQPLENEPDGGISIQRIAKAIKPDDIHFARTRDRMALPMRGIEMPPSGSFRSRWRMSPTAAFRSNALPKPSSPMTSISLVRAIGWLCQCVGSKCRRRAHSAAAGE